MSDEIQAIAQNNYILHNIDAKKLYVQEPLFTANSGDAVYVGWRPDETVLWEGTMNTTAQTATVNEPISSFNTIQVWARRNVNGLERAGLVQEFYPTINVDNNTYFYPVYTDMASNTLFQNMMYLKFTGNNFSLLRGWQKNGTAETTGVSTYGFNIEKIVGVNRKENA